MYTKKKTTHAPKADTHEVQLERFEYWKKITANDFKQLVFLDETGIQLGITQRYARSEQGQRAYGTAPYPHGNIITLLGAIKFDGVVATMTVNGGTTGNVFRTFIKKILLPELSPGDCLVADNLPAHYTNGIKEIVESVGATIVYLSSYSPDFNPIEHWWSQLKAFLRTIKPQTREELEYAISQNISMVSDEHLKNWFTHCCYCSLLT
ncbi:MAG: IS630 family transposase [Symploca sp. SIO1B1]|nr:IS630 family transposase [Symploca sp. SIO1B1]